MIPFITGLICSIFIGHIQSATAREVVCGFPGTPAYGYVKPDLEAYEEGDVVSYSCRVGYILLGSPISRCTSDGSWTEEVPICDDSMTTLGVAFSTPTVPGHAAEMAIDRDKETCSYLKPKTPRWWRIDLGNTHKVLSVAVTMMQPDKNVKFTIYIIKTNEGSASYKRCASFSGKFGTQTVVMSCAEGKGIIGEKVHIEDHLQNGGLFEICEVEVQVEKDTGYDCGRPSRSLYSISYAPRGNRVDYGCIRGYEIKGKHYRHCLNTGQWSGEPPECEPIICDELEELENGQITLSPENGQPLEGTIAIYKCDEGYKLIGSFTRNCLKDGSWSGRTPQCKAIRCPLPDGKDVGGIYRLVNKTNSMGSMALLRCKKGKREGDNPYIVCTEDGTWTKPESHCILPAGAAYEIQEEPKIANQGAIIFGMIVAGMMIVSVLVALYAYTQKRRSEEAAKPVIPKRLTEPVDPPPRPPPRSKEGGLKSAFMGFISRDSSKSEDEKELQNSLQKSPYSTDDPALIEVEVLPQGEPKRNVYPVPEENESTSLDGRDSSQKEPSDYASVDYNKKRRSRLMKDQDSIDSSSTAAASPIPPDESEKKSSPTPPKESEEEEESEEESDTSAKRKAEEEAKKAKEEEERKAKEEEEKKKAQEEEEKKKAKEEEEKKERETTGRRRRTRDEPPPPAEEEKPALRRFRRFQ